jgi:hypothetical protein
VVSTQIATDISRPRSRRSNRAVMVQALGPLTALIGVAWAILQPYRITLLDPHGQGFWWLFSEPPLYVIVVGVFFQLVIAPSVVADLEEAERR